jgi:hypothetical protein
MMHSGMTERTDIERIVMQRVYLIRALKVAISTSTLSTLVSLLALWGIGRQVWVAQVLHNAPTDPINLFWFYSEAFLHTSVTVQLLVLVMLISIFYIAREVARAVAFMRAQELS